MFISLASLTLPTLTDLAGGLIFAVIGAGVWEFAAVFSSALRRLLCSLQIGP